MDSSDADAVAIAELPIIQIPVDELVLDPTLNLRDKLDDDAITRYAESWDRLPPVTVFEVDGQWILADGFLRHAAAITARKKSLAAEVHEGTLADALEFAAGANTRHGMPLNRAERRRAIEVKLRLHPDWSDRRIADELSVSRDSVAKARKQLVEGGQIPSSSARIGADGRAYPATLPKDPNERLPRVGDSAGEVTPESPRRGKAEAPWDDTVDPISQGIPISSKGRPQGGATPPWDDAPGDAPNQFSDYRTLAESPPITPSAPTIDEMLGVMTQQIEQLIKWTEADGFVPAFREASGKSRLRLQKAANALADRVTELGRA